jgi:hypothetical protein
MELDKWLWKDRSHISIKELWDYLSTYLYLSRLRNSDVLMNTIREGVKTKDYFGYATSIDEKGNYLGLLFGIAGSSIYLDSNSLLIKADFLLKQSMAQRTPQNTVQTPSNISLSSYDDLIKPEQERSKPISSLPRRFYGSSELDPTRMWRDVDRIAEEVVQHLQALVGSKVEITLEIKAELTDGIPNNVVRTIIECNTLNLSSSILKKSNKG